MRPIIMCCLLASLLYAAPGQSSAAHGVRPAWNTAGVITINGYTRRFVYEIAAAPAPAAGRPLVIQLHGDGGDMGISAAWRAAVLSDANGAVFLSAQGRNNIPAAAAIDGSGWRFRMDEAGDPYDDIDFIDQLIAAAIAPSRLLGTPIDPAQVYVVGESRGAGFAYFLYADPRTRNDVRALVPLSGTFYCDGAAENAGTPGTTAVPGSDLVCGEISEFGYWGPKPGLFEAPGVTRATHILDVHGQLAPDGTEFPETAPPSLDQDYASSTWTGWGDAAGCYTVRVSAQTERTLPQPIGGRTVKSYAYSQAENALATRCAGLDLTFYVVQGGGHVPGGFELTAWCFLSTIGGRPSASACPNAATPTNTATVTRIPATPTNTTTATVTRIPATPTNTPTATVTPLRTATRTGTITTATRIATPTTTPTISYTLYLPFIQR